MTAAEYGIRTQAAEAWSVLVDALEVHVVPCRVSSTPGLWFATSPEAAELALAGCLDCPVMVACGAYADAAREPDGVWGGRLRKKGRVIA
jgi:WhiB family redox-sensing transcriptional regulator